MSPAVKAGRAVDPYPGLRPFSANEVDIFFGREDQTDQIVEKLANHRFLGVVGISGCGKSSLAKAGVIPALQTGLIAGAGSRWRVVTMKPGDRPMANLADALLQPGVLDRGTTQGSSSAGTADDPGPVRAAVLAMLRRSPLGLAEVLAGPLTPGGSPALPPKYNMLLLVDQFEEIFRFRQGTEPKTVDRDEADRDEADAFVSLLLESARQERMQVYVMLTMRSDYLGDCAVFTGLPEQLNDSQFLTPRLSAEQRREAIECPAKVRGGRVDRDLVSQLLADMGPEPDQLPLMQHALMRLWDLAKDRPRGDDGRVELTLADYKEIGGLAKALDGHAEEVYQSLADPSPAAESRTRSQIKPQAARHAGGEPPPSEKQEIAEVLFRCLSERESGGRSLRRDIRRPTRLGVVADVAGKSIEEVTEVVEAFRAAGVNFVTASDVLDKDTVLDISHESLILRWKRLRGWVDDEARSADIYRRLEQSARLQLEGKGSYIAQPELDDVSKWWKTRQPTREWSNRYGHHFELAKGFLDSSRIHWELRQKREWWNRTLLVGAAIVLPLLAGGLLAYSSRIEEIKNANKTKDLLNTKLRSALADARVAALRSLSFLASATSPQLGVLLAAAAVDEMERERQKWRQTPAVLPKLALSALDSESALRRALGSISGRGFGGHRGAVTAVSIDPQDQSLGVTADGRHFATGGADGRILLHPLAPEEPLAAPIVLDGSTDARERWGLVDALYIAHQGRWLVAASRSAGAVRLWDLRSAPYRRVDLSSKEHRMPLDLSLGSRWALTYEAAEDPIGSGYQLRVWDLAADDPKPFDLGLHGKVNLPFWSFSRDGKRLALYWADSTGFAWDLTKAPGADGFRPRSLSAVKFDPGTRAMNSEFAEDGRLVVTYSDGKARYFDPAAIDKEPTTVALVLGEATAPTTLATDYRGLWIVTSETRAAGATTTSPIVQASPSPPPPNDTPSRIGVRPESERTTYVWNLSKAPNKPEPTARLNGFPSSMGLPHVVVDPSGRRLLAVSSDGRLLLWNLNPPAGRFGAGPPPSARGTGIAPLTLLGTESPGQGFSRNVASVVISRDARWALARVAGLRESPSRPYLWDLDAPNPTQYVALPGHERPLSEAVLSPDNRRLVTASQDSTARVWDLDVLSISAQPVGISSSIDGVALSTSSLISDNRRWLAAIDLNANARLYDLNADDPTARPIPLTPKGRLTRALATSVDGHWLGLVGDHDSTLLNLEDPQPAARPVVFEGLPPAPPGRIEEFGRAIVTDSQGRWFATDSNEWSDDPKSPSPMARRIRLWSRPSGAGNAHPITLKEATSLPSLQAPWSRSIVIDRTGRRMAVLRGGNLLLWTLADPDPSTSAVALWKTEEGATAASIQGFWSTPDGARIVALIVKPEGHSQTSVLLCWDLSADDPVRTARTGSVAGVPSRLPGPPRYVFTITSDGRWLIDSNQDRVRLLSLEPSDIDKKTTYDPLVLVPSESVSVVSFSRTDPKGRWLVAADPEDGIRLWDLTRCVPKTKSEPFSLPGGKGQVSLSGGFTVDGRWLAMGSGDSASLWRLGDHPPDKQLSLTGLKGQIIAIAVSPNEDWFAIAGSDGMIRLFDCKGDARDGAIHPVAAFPGHGIAPGGSDLAVSRDGNRVLSTTYYAAAISTRSLIELLDVARRAVGRNLSREEWDQYMPRGGTDKVIPRLVPDLGVDTGPATSSAPPM